jgi:OmpA-OmpF porin, OOP family
MIKSCRLGNTLLLFPLVVAASAWAAPADLKQSSDHPLVSRFHGAIIIGARTADFGTAALPLSPSGAGGSFAKALHPSGKLTTLAYEVPGNKDAVEVFESYRQSLTAAGFHVVFKCTQGRDDGGCGGYPFASAVADPAIEGMRGDKAHVGDVLDAANGNVFYLTATLDRPAGKASVGVLVSREDDKPAGVLLQVIEEGIMEKGQVTVDANAMSKGLATEGKIALYGLTFDTDSARLTPASDPTLKQMSDLLHQQPNLKVYIVGHTDDTGALAHNVTLSQQRAESVVKALTTTYGVAANRLSAKGLASYAPVASNHSDAGKAKNRRVELVEQ